MNAVVHFSEDMPSDRWLRFASLAWNNIHIYSDYNTQYNDEFLSELPQEMRGFVNFPAISIDNLPDSVWNSFAIWLDRYVPDPEAYFNLQGIPTSFFTLDINPCAGVAAERLTLCLAAKGLLRSGDYYGRDEGGWHYRPVSLDEVLKDKSNDWQDQRSEFHSRSMRLVAPVILINQLKFLSVAFFADEDRADTYVRIDPTVFAGAPTERSSKSDLMLGLLWTRIPSDLAHIEWTALLDLRDDLASKRLMFQIEIEKIVKELNTVSSISAAKSTQKQILDVAHQRMIETEKAYKTAKLSANLRAFAVTVTPPALMSFVASSLNIGLFEPVAIAGSIAAGCAAIIAEREKANAIYRASPWSYLGTLNSKMPSTSPKNNKNLPLLFEDIEPTKRQIHYDVGPPYSW